MISLALVSNKYRVTLDTEIDNAFHVHKDDGSIRRFHKGGNNLCYYDVRDLEGALLAITTVESQKQLYSSADRKRAKRAQALQQIMMFPSNKDFVKALESKVIQNCAVTRRDIDIAEQIHGKCKASIKGKTTRRQAPQVREEFSLVPEHVLTNYGNITLCCDIFYVNKVMFFATLSLHLKYRTVKAITNARKHTLLNALKQVINHYLSRGFKVTTVLADNQFACVNADLQQIQPGIIFNPTAANEHQPHIKRDNQTNKEQIRAGFHSVPFKRLPIRMLVELVYCCFFWQNRLLLFLLAK